MDGRAGGCVCCQTEKKVQSSFCPYLTYDSLQSFLPAPIILIFLPLFLLFLGNYPQIRGCEGERDRSFLFFHFRPKLGCSRRTLSPCFVFPFPLLQVSLAPSHRPSLSCLLSMKSTSLSFPFLSFFSLLLHCEEGGWTSWNRGNSCCRFCSFSEEQFHQVHYTFCSKV